MFGLGSEREYLEKIEKVRDKSNKKSNEIADSFQKMHKLKSEAVKKNEEMLSDSRSNLVKLEKNINTDKDVAAESKQRIAKEIAATRTQIQGKYGEWKEKIDDTEIP